MLIRLIIWNFITSIFAFGGGSSLLSYLYEVYVVKLHILKYINFINISLISQILPGPVSLSFLAIVGFKVSKFYGWLISIISFSLVTSIFSFIFYKQAFKVKIIKKLTVYLLPVILVSLLFITIQMFKLPLKFMYNEKNIIQIIFMIVLTVILKYFKFNNNIIVILNILFTFIIISCN